MKRAHYVVLVALLTMLLAGCGSPLPIPEEAINGAYDVINQYDGVSASRANAGQPSVYSRL